MKRVLFILVALCALSSFAVADDDQFSSEARDHITKGHQLLRAGKLREALAHFCSYIYIDAAGEFADEASLNARTISGRLGNPTQSDHDACETTRPPAAEQTAQPTTMDIIAIAKTKRPRMYKREYIGLGIVGLSVVSLGLALREGGKVVDLRTEIDNKPAGVDLDGLRDRESSAQLRQKLFLVGGGAALLSGGIMYVLGRRDRLAAEKTLVVPNIGRGQASVSVSRKF